MIELTPEMWQEILKRATIVFTTDYLYQFDSHVHAYLEEMVDRTEAASVAHVFGTYY